MSEASRAQGRGRERPAGDAGLRPRSAPRAAPPDPNHDWVRGAVARFERPLVRYALHVTGDAERARDVVQEVFLRLCDQDRGRVAPHLTEWLYTVTRNLAIDVRRKERRTRLLAEATAEGHEAPDEPPDRPAEREDEYASVLTAMEDLPDNQQEVIRLKFQHGLSYKQISEITGLSVTNVGFLLHVGLKALRRRLGEAEGPGESESEARARYAT
jgi:RNA polymerase sigma-70 factor (ECF subfamily)